MTSDLSLPPLDNLPETLQRTWREEYRAKRYMEHLAIGELNRRAADLMTNLCTLTPAGQFGWRSLDGDGGQWWHRWTHVCEEFQLRFGPYPQGFSKDVLIGFRPPKTTYPKVPPAYKALVGASLERGRFLLKLGQKAHMEAMLHTGCIRIAPASEYRDPSLNAAVHDDELSFESIAQPGFKLGVSPVSGGPFIPLGGLKSFRMKSTLRTDYFVYCMTHAADHRLFDDFGYDTCVAITKPREFLKRLVAAVKLAMPDWKSGGGKVTYADPHFTNSRDLSRDLMIPMTKHFRYAYQYEYRVFWLHDSPQTGLKPFFVHLGSLHDFATLITLPGTAGTT